MGYHPTFKNTFFAVMVGYFANMAFPRLGEVTRCGILTRYEKIPFNLQAGISKRLKHAPINLALNMQYLNHWDLGNPDPSEPSSNMDFFEREEGFGKQIMRHMVLGFEILPSENFTLRAGYNYQRRQELKFNDKASMVGFSAGFGLKIKRFRLDYAISQYHLAGSSNLFSLAININNNL